MCVYTCAYPSAEVPLAPGRPVARQGGGAARRAWSCALRRALPLRRVRASVSVSVSMWRLGHHRYHTYIIHFVHTLPGIIINLVRRPPSSYNPKNPGSDADANSLNLKRVKGLEQRRSLALEEGVFTGEEDELVGALCLRCV